jgi:peptide/histidine transporter 3/4
LKRKECVSPHPALQIQVWSGTCYITLLLGAFISDAYWGRFWTILVFSIAYMIGMVGLALDAGLPGLRPDGASLASGGQLAFFWVSMYLVALGTGGIKPCVSAFGADQVRAQLPCFEV